MSADAELKNCGMITRKPSTPLKPFLLDARQTGYPLEGARLDLVEQFANCYEHARHDPAVSITWFLPVYLYCWHASCELLPFVDSRVVRIAPVPVAGWKL